MLHDSLPRLRSLTMNGVSIYGDIPEHITPCDTVRDLSWAPADGHLWGPYFARKYTKLKKLKMRLWWENCEDTRDDIIMLVKSCRHLEWFDCWGKERISSIIYREALKVFHEIGAPLTYFNFNNWDSLLYAATVDSFYRTVSNVSFCTERITKVNKVVKPLEACLSLVELRLHCLRADLEVDYILNHCKSLKSLDILGRTIRVSNHYTVNNQHKLRKLMLHGDNIEHNVFLHLSQHCSHLSNLECGYNSGSSKNCTIHFTIPGLQRLSVICHGDVVYKLTQLDKTERAIEQNVKYHGSLDGYKIKGWTRWYCSGEPMPGVLRQLRPSEIDNISHQLRNVDDGCNVKQWEDDDEDQELLNNNNNQRIISIRYHSVNEIRLQGVILKDKAGV
ncbi:hypothetical protein DFQ30_001642 [Apophysomyces sp. BC1015]|nr:hypothetical protein DFQ30_001642 [Apophysomyces sp. BC1015]